MNWLEIFSLIFNIIFGVSFVFLLVSVGGRGKPQYTQKVNNDWFNVPEFKTWLQEHPKDKNKLYCKFCQDNSGLAPHRRNLSDHINTKKHQAAAKSQTPNTRKITQLFTKPVVNKDKARAETYLTLFVCEHCSLRTADHLAPVIACAYPGAPKVELGRTRCSQIVTNVIGPFFRNDLIKDIGNSKYSLILDESNDVTSNKILGAVIRYYSVKQQKIVCTFLGFIHLTSFDADGIYGSLLTFLRENRIDINNLIGIGTDGASVMVGVHAGLFKKLKAILPNLILVRCVCHSLQLATSHATDLIPDEIEDLINDTHNWFSYSSKRIGHYTQIYRETHGKDPIKIQKNCATRWLSILPAINGILDQFDDLRRYFRTVYNEEKKSGKKGKKACEMYNLYTRKNKLYLIFLQSILKPVDRVNKNFEATMQDPTLLFNDLYALINELISTLIFKGPGDNILTCDLKERVNVRPYLGANFENACEWERRNYDPTDPYKVSMAEINIVRENCIKFLTKLIEEIRARVPENMNIMKNISLFSVKNVLRQNVDIIPNDILKVCPCDSGDVNFQYKALNGIDWTEKTDTMAFWTEVLNYTDASNNNPFFGICSLALSILSLPHSNADVERLFSQMKIVKSSSRNRMLDPMLNAIMYVRAGLKRLNNSCFNFIAPDELINAVHYFRCNSSSPITASNIATTASTSTATASTSTDDCIIQIDNDNVVEISIPDDDAYETFINDFNRSCCE